ncbi:hypothetical protein [Paenibacillus campi]|uniref:hypothetical protein n=1 Tax=Paenibacillus campi TaxID=3106031 RepID=UPI002AFEC5BF|nr:MULTISPECIES: hypothetical protein [unclassified Paenibacillus]
MKVLRKFILAFLLSNVIGHWSFKQIAFLQYDLTAGLLSTGNIVRYLVNLACYIAVAVWVYRILERLEAWYEQRKQQDR